MINMLEQVSNTNNAFSNQQVSLVLWKVKYDRSQEILFLIMKF